MPVRLYLDTNVLRNILSRLYKTRNASRRLFARLESDDYEVKVPQTVMGEAVTTVMRDYEPADWEALVGRIMGEVAKVADPATCFPPPDPTVAAKAQEVMREIKGMTKTDAFIVAQALLDPESQRLVTTDRLILKARWLVKEEARMRRSGERSRRLMFTKKEWLDETRQQAHLRPVPGHRHGRP